MPFAAINALAFDNVLEPYLKDNKIKKIDYLVLSHPNLDHYSGFENLVNTYKVNMYVKNGFASDSKAYNTLQKTLAKKKLKAVAARAGMNFSLGNEVKWEILSPINNDYSNEDNDLSVIMLVTYKGKKILVTGDASGKAEEGIVKKYGKGLKSDVLLVSHHGSKHSSVASFIRTVHPKIAVISCGVNNSYGHPHSQVLQKLNKIKAKIYRTDKQGSVIIKIYNKKITVKKMGKKKQNKSKKYFL